MELEKDDQVVTTRLYKRRIWVTILLTLFGSGLPLIYCGRFKAGIILESVLIVVGYSLIAASGFLSNLTAYLILVLLLIIIFISVLTFNIRFTIRANRLNYPRRNKTWTWILIVFVASLVISGLCDIAIETYISKAYRMPSSSMEPTLFTGDYLMVSKGGNPEKLVRGDVIIFKYPPDPGQNYIKRLIAKPGDEIGIKDKEVYLNGEKLDEPYAEYIDSRILPYYNTNSEWGLQCRDNMPAVAVPENMYFVLGDNRDNSSDSRFWGFVPGDLIVGKARFIHFSWDSEAHRPRWNRIGKRLDNIVIDQSDVIYTEAPFFMP